jgi:aminoglycoside phosphotransferase family enzyme
MHGVREFDSAMRGEDAVASPGIAAKVAFLSCPESYPTPPPRVEVVETHMSWVFLTDRHAYKLKKPIHSDCLDFRTLDARRQNCEAEVRLNRRLAANVYEGLVPLRLDPQGQLQLAGTGETVDWLVKMRRLPAARMLDCVIVQGTVHATDVRKVGSLLARCYLQTPSVAMAPATYRRRLADNVQANRRELMKPVYGLSTALVEAVLLAQLAFLEQEPTLFDRRVHAGWILEAHGDLRPEHICLEDEPVIIDCLEFNRELRILDTLSELAFLALECERLGAPAVGARILEVYRTATGDTPPARLLTFYKSYHAALRAKIAIWHLRDPEVRHPATWTDKAQQYLRLAAQLPRLMQRR